MRLALATIKKVFDSTKHIKNIYAVNLALKIRFFFGISQLQVPLEIILFVIFLKNIILYVSYKPSKRELTATDPWVNWKICI